jgi:hypothetical protein
MKYAVEMASCGMTCIPSFMTISSGVQKFWGRDKHINSEVISKLCFYFFFFKIRGRVKR